MYGRPLLFLLAVTALGITAEQRKLHRLVGGHLRIINPDSEDSELMKLEATGAAREKKHKSEQEEKKTLAQQVADGKYGLIQKELFSKPQKRPGVLSYDDNSDVPNDNKDNLGGLHKNEIWLAENHLLVLRGGTYPPHEEKPNNAVSPWSPIDDFKAPLHQVKIPKHPKVPPPFPVQFTDGGPLQIIGTNSTRTINESVASTGYALPPPEGFQPDTDPHEPPDHTHPANATSGQTPLPIPLYPPGDYPEGVPFPPFPLNGTLPPYFASLPPGAAILPPPSNQSEQYDEDDPSIYYPPPYSFYYPKDNSSVVKPGPLVPGIILPPPPNFFGPLEETTTNTTSRMPQRHRKPTTEKHPQIHPTTTPLPPTEKSTTKKPFKVYPAQDPYLTNEVSSTFKTTKEPDIVTVLPMRQTTRNHTRTSKPQQQRKRPQVTVLQPVKVNTPPPTYAYENEISDRPFASYGPPRATKKSSVTTTQIPLKYFTTVNEIETNSVTQSPVTVHVQKTTQKPIQFYFYEEEFEPNSVTTQQNPVKQSTYVPENYYKPPKPTPVRQRKPQYIYVNARPYNTQKPKFRYVSQPVKTDTFSIHIAKLQNQIQYYTTSRPTYRPVHSPKPIYQFSFQAANYQRDQGRFKPSQPDSNQQDQFRPIPKYSVQIQQAIEIIPTEPPASNYQQSPSPVYYNQNYQGNSERPGRYYTTNRPNYAYETITENSRYQNVVTPKPVSQFAFEATPNPIYQGFYTKPDEGFFDDNTKKYFTMFGRKLPSSTSALPNIEQTTAKPNFVYSNEQQQISSQYNQRPISLESDTLVNYVQPRPTVNPEAEIIPVNQPPNYSKVVTFPVRSSQYPQQQNLPQREENPEIIKAIPIEVPSDDGQEGSFISYQLPGDRGAHFYFLTPQLSQQREQGSSYYYSQPNASRSRRNEKKDKER